MDRAADGELVEEDGPGGFGIQARWARLSRRAVEPGRVLSTWFAVGSGHAVGALGIIDSSPHHRNPLRCPFATSKSLDRIGGRRPTQPWPRPNSISAMDAASSWTPPIPSPRRSERSPGRTEPPTTPPRKVRAASKSKPRGSRNPCPAGAISRAVHERRAIFRRISLTHPAKSGDSSPRWP